MIYKNVKTGITFESDAEIKGADIVKVEPAKKESQKNGRKNTVRHSK